MNAGPVKFDVNVGSILQAMILAALLWVGTSINTLNAQMAAVQVQVGGLADLARRISSLEIEQARAATERSSIRAQVDSIRGQADNRDNREMRR